MTELPVLAAMFESRSVYEQFDRCGDPDALSPFGKLVYKGLRDYYSIDRDVQRCDRLLVYERIARGFTNPKHETAFREFASRVPDSVSSANIAHDIAELRREQLGQQLSLALANRADRQTVETLVEKYRSVSNGYGESASVEDAELVHAFDTTRLLTEADDSAGRYKLYPKALNDRCAGGARPGHHILVFARPEAGKTAFVLNMFAGFVAQGLGVLYVGNEEPIADLQDRLWGRLLKLPRAEIKADRVRAAEAIAKLSGDFHFAGMHPGNYKSIERLIERTKPKVLILDQLRNLNVDADTKTGELEEAAKSARSLAKKYSLLVISVTQAGNSADGKVYLSMTDVDSSKTGIPAAVDLMIGVGGDDSMKAHGLMGVSLPKNKLSGDHGNFTVTANFATGVII